MNITNVFCAELEAACVRHDGPHAQLAFGRFLLEATEAGDFPRFALPLPELARRAIADTPSDLPRRQ